MEFKITRDPTYQGSVKPSSNDVKHWKYIKREKGRDGKWKYYYKTKENYEKTRSKYREAVGSGDISVKQLNNSQEAWADAAKNNRGPSDMTEEEVKAKSSEITKARKNFEDAQQKYIDAGRKLSPEFSKNPDGIKDANKNTKLTNEDVDRIYKKTYDANYKKELESYLIHDPSKVNVPDVIRRSMKDTYKTIKKRYPKTEKKVNKVLNALYRDTSTRLKGGR